MRAIRLLPAQLDLVNRDHATIRVIASNWNWIYCDLIIHMGCFILMRAIWDVYPWIVVGKFFDINKYLFLSFLFFSLFSFFFFLIVITLVASYGHCERTVVVTWCVRIIILYCVQRIILDMIRNKYLNLTKWIR